jgi:hypothetical protein
MERMEETYTLCSARLTPPRDEGVSPKFLGQKGMGDPGGATVAPEGLHYERAVDMECMASSVSSTADLRQKESRSFPTSTPAWAMQCLCTKSSYRAGSVLLGIPQCLLIIGDGRLSEVEPNSVLCCSCGKESPLPSTSSTAQTLPGKRIYIMERPCAVSFAEQNLLWKA